MKATRTNLGYTTDTAFFQDAAKLGIVLGSTATSAIAEVSKKENISPMAIIARLVIERIAEIGSGKLVPRRVMGDEYMSQMINANRDRT